MNTQMNQNNREEFNGNGHPNSENRNTPSVQTRQTIIARDGNNYTPLRTRQIAVFCSCKKAVVAIDFAGKKHHIDETLTDIESVLESNSFFRVNRNIILNIEAIRMFRIVEFGKIVVDLHQENWLEEAVHISQYRAPRFREWISGL